LRRFGKVDGFRRRSADLSGRLGTNRKPFRLTIPSVIIFDMLGKYIDSEPVIIAYYKLSEIHTEIIP
jgi:hypothetical protein